MKGKTVLLILTLFLSTVAHSESIRPNKILSFDDRLFYQQKIERIYWQERIWRDKNTSKPPFEELMPPEVIRTKVENYLRKANALDFYWHKPIQESQIQAEMDRMIRNTKNPKMLQRIFDALNNDPNLIAQCLAFPLLANRLIKNRYSSDAVFHAYEKLKASQDALLITNVEAMRSTSGNYYEFSFSINDDEFKEINSRYSKMKLRVVSKLQEDSERFYVIAVLERTEEALRLAVVEWKKKSFDSWWRIASKDIPIAEPNFDPSAFASQNTVNQSDCVDQTWTAIPAAPQPRDSHIAFWTGSEMLIWGGGTDGFGYLNNGGRYDPATDTWSPISTIGAPGPNGAAVWTGSEMILWDGISGGRYNPSTDTWLAISTIGAPQTGGAVWTGTEMLVWNGSSGGRYNPTNDSWSPITMIGAPPAVQYGATAVWSGSEMIVWGGTTSSGNHVNTGGRYNPSNDTWAGTSIVSAPAPRCCHTAVWSGSEMIIYGGDWETTGGRYNPVTDSWVSTSTIGAPSVRENHTAVWAGNAMMIWGGSSFNDTSIGGLYFPSTDTWLSTTIINRPDERDHNSIIWTGTEVIVWGGQYYGKPFDTGGRYDPVTNSWVLIGNGSITPRYLHTAVWTGTEMIIWGGNDGFSFYDLNSGGIYDPALDSWTSTNEADAPSVRKEHTAVWSGSEMIVWGGSSSQSGGYYKTGGRYNPSTDSWLPTDVSQAPSARDEHSAIWTGSQMVIWGGTYGADPVGGVYQPDFWTPTSIVGAPEARWLHSANWTGSEMIVWGGNIVNTGATNTGGKYNPLTDSWLLMNNADAPSARYRHSAIWSGEELIVWGGDANPGILGDGKRYQPSTDSWSDISNVNSPGPRRQHTAVRAGGQMIIWGGESSYHNFLNDGGIYSINDDSWSSISTLNAPNPRAGHTAVWTGTQMIIWGGVPFDASGGLFCLTAPTAFDDTYDVDENSTLNIPAPGVLSNDVDPQEDVLTAERVSGPAHGDLTLNSDGSFVYTPNVDFEGVDNFVYRCKNATYPSNDAAVTIYVGNQPPVSNPDTANTVEDTPVTVEVLLNDSDPDGDPIHVVSVTAPQNGTAVINTDDTITYTPNPTFSGTDSFDYTIDDDQGATDSASVTITVAEINQPPVANPDSASTSESTPVTIDVLSNDSDPDGDPIHVVNVTTPQNGTAVINPDDTITYTPNSTFTGTDSFDYTIDDGHGGTASASVTITVADICLFCDDFEDGVLASDWTYLKGSWNESNGSLIADPLGKKSLAIATPAFSGCSTCTIETSMESDGGLFGKVWLLSWYIDKGNRIELLMKEDQDKWILKQRVGGAVVAKAKSISTIDPNVFYDVSLRFDGASIILEVNGTELISISAVGTPSGTIGFQSKKAVSRFGYININ